MCGRFVQYSHPEVYATHFGAELAGEASGPRYNLAPTQPVLAVRETREGRRELVPLRLGLVPSWSKGPDSRYSMIVSDQQTTPRGADQGWGRSSGAILKGRSAAMASGDWALGSSVKRKRR